MDQSKIKMGMRKMRMRKKTMKSHQMRRIFRVRTRDSPRAGGLGVSEDRRPSEGMRGSRLTPFLQFRGG